MITKSKTNFFGNLLNNIKSKFILKKIVDNIKQKRLLKLINYNKNFQEKLGIGIKDYKKYYEQIIIEIIPIDKINNNYRNYFINIPYKYKSFYHTYFNEDEKEKKRLF